MNHTIASLWQRMLLSSLLTFTGVTSFAKEPLPLTNPPPVTVTLTDFKLAGDLAGDRATFTLNATAVVDDRKGGSLDLLSGALALTEVAAHPKWQLRTEQGRYVAVFEQAGKFPIMIRFTAAVKKNAGWSAVDFRVASSAVQPVALHGLAEDTQFEFAGAARPERKGTEFASFLPADGAVKLAWKESRKQEEGKLFFAANMLSQISLSPGLMTQVALLDFKVMQGEVSRVTLLLRGPGEVTRVQGEQILSWSVEPATDKKVSSERRLVIQLNQPQKESFALQVQLQSALGAFPQTAEVMRIQPEGATRFAGFLRIVNEGAVRLEVTQASGLSQISPEQFPESDATRAAFRAGGSQRFAYRFSSADYALRVQADQIQPELSVSEILAYHHGQNELVIDAELEFDVREAPLRELLLNVPRGYAIARLNASGMSDYFVRDVGEASNAELRIVYGQPVSGRQVVQLRLERNKPLGEASWALPRIEVAKAKSVRGNVGVSADAGFRLTTERTQALTETATAFFPRKVANLQTAFRLSESGWSAALRVERLPQTVTADGFHLFSIGEGIAYGSSVMNYLISGAPVSVLRVALSDEYFNVEFTGKDVRNWEKTTNGYLVQLHSPVAGAYTLLATYERPFKSQGETLAFTGAQPLDAQSESGHTLVISAYQFQVKPADVSASLLPLETGEVPAEYRLFFDAPILAAYRYTARPFNLKLTLSPLAQGDSLSQVVDRASLVTRISKEGQVLMDATYFVKNRGNPNFKVTLPAQTELWSATVNGASVVPVKDKDANLIPLPQRVDPNSILKLELKLATKSASAANVKIAAPVVNAPVMLAEWRVEPDAGQRLIYAKGSLKPVSGEVDISGFAQLARMLNSGAGRITSQAAMAIVLVLAGLILWRWASATGVTRFSARHVLGTLLGLAAMAGAAIALAPLFDTARAYADSAPDQLAFLAPVQQAGSATTIEVQNVEAGASTTRWTGSGLMVLIALALWGVALLREDNWQRTALRCVSWTLMAWAALRSPNGAPWFLFVLAAFLALNLVLPALRRLWSVPRRGIEPEASGSPAVAVLLIGGFLFFGVGCATAKVAPKQGLSSIEAVKQEIRIEENFALATVKLRWQADKGQVLPILSEPAVLTGITFPKDPLKLTQARVGERRVQQLAAERAGTFDIEVKYQVQVTKGPAESVIALPTPCGLVNQLNVTVVGADVDVYSAQAVSVQRELSGTNTLAALVLSPVSETKIGWKPRSRDVKREKAVFYAELQQLYSPSAGVIEGAHLVSVRPAQGELTELVFDVPRGATITDVLDASVAEKRPALVSVWRFDPDARKLRVTLSPAQSRPFALLVRSQVATGPLPFEQSVGLLSVEGAAGQIGLLGVATGTEVQLDNVTVENCTPINLEDFPTRTTAALASQINGLTVRRAFRYADGKAAAVLKASPVEPDVRVEMQNTLSLGEDRTVLAANFTVDITRAGIFKLSFVMPDGFDVESISGSALSHWTELKGDAGRVITLNLKGKTEGRQQFAINLAGAGVKSAANWSVPQLALREASKQQGTLVVVPEQGMQLQATTLEGVSQLDPQKSGIRQKGVLAFRILQSPWQLALKVEQVDAWIQVTSLQHATISEAQVKVAANLQYQIENTGLKMLRVWLPADAESVRFAGEQLADFLQVAGATANGMQQWEVKLQRRVIGQFLLSVNYQTLVANQSPGTALRGVRAADVNLQRGFVTVQAGGRLQVRVDDAPAALQPTEWQSIPRALLANLQSASANFTYRLVEPDFNLALKLDRHEAAKLLAARVNNINLTSVISDDGIMLTQVRLELLPRDKRLLALTLPAKANFWFAFVNQNGVWPWREGDKILIPLEPQSRAGQATPVEIFYSSQIGQPGSPALDLQLFAPKFDLPLENIAWRVHLNEKWQVKDWKGTLQLSEEEVAPVTAALDLEKYLAGEVALQRGKTQEAEQMLAFGNSALAGGDPQQARRAFQSAYGLSTHDNAFNEDARVQLHNLKLQQALVGLNVRQAATAGDTAALGARFRDLRGVKELNYSQQDAKAIIDRNSADDNAASMRLAEKLIQQQDAAVSSASAIRANIPEQGRVLTFKRSVAVDREADLQLALKISEVKAASSSVRGLMLGAILVGFGALGLIARSLRRVETV